uniref:Uncharacterized protein n=1 Tax=Catagonus wagneri TaxID=51154 RepID=A0A8C3VP67_9CETA
QQLRSLSSLVAQQVKDLTLSLQQHRSCVVWVRSLAQELPHLCKDADKKQSRKPPTLEMEDKNRRSRNGFY